MGFPEIKTWIKDLYNRMFPPIDLWDPTGCLSRAFAIVVILTLLMIGIMYLLGWIPTHCNC